MFGKILVYTLIALILITLFSALGLLFKKDGKKDQMAKALAIRVGLSVSLFLLLMAGFYFGLIPSKGLR